MPLRATQAQRVSPPVCAQDEFIYKTHPKHKRAAETVAAKGFDGGIRWGGRGDLSCAHTFCPPRRNARALFPPRGCRGLLAGGAGFARITVRFFVIPCVANSRKRSFLP
jgi:hypothetical protein